MMKSESEGAVDLLGIGCSEDLPAFKQRDLAALYADYLERTTSDKRLARRASLLFARAGVDTRRLALAREGGSRVRELYEGGALPTTGQRMAMYRDVAPQLAVDAARQAISNAGISPDEIGSVVLATCTGVGEPDFDVELATRLGLRPDVERSQLIWMSCSAAFPALRIARRSALAQKRPALVVCVEVCSLHIRIDADPGSLLAHALFADGAAAMVVAAPSKRGALATFSPGQVQRLPHARDALTWNFTDHGFRVHLASELSSHLARDTGSFVRELEPDWRDLAAWCVHPGSPAILSAVEGGLGLPPDALATSRDVLRNCGNMSSPTILYVLKAHLANLSPGERGLMLGFGTGVTIEGVPFEKGARSLS